ncbi:MAG: diguanylate cyclase [Solirubrobacteraceae bacterium]|nr:diguanylate cyclase [Solirubrobacteraceae bacterium]
MGEAERARVVDFARRVRGTWRPASITLILMGGLAAAFGAGPAAILPAFVLAVAVGWYDRADFGDVARPEWVVLAVLAVGQLAIGAFIALSDRYRLDALDLFILPVVAACLIFPRRLAYAAAAWSVLVMAGVAFAIDPSLVLDDPPILILPLGVMLCVALPAAMVRELEIASRDTASIDTLTGALNRGALESRITELDGEVTAAMASRVGVIMADLDHFKAVNDELGHDAGDGVLREVVQRIRAVLGPLTPVYRVGGEEFAVLMAGADVAQVTVVAERLLEAVHAAPIGGRDITMSFGVAAGTLDREAVTDVLERADEALYLAKRAGRDQVMPAAMRLVDDRHEAEPAVGSDQGQLQAVDGDGGERAGRAHTALEFEHDRGNWLVRGDFERDHIREHAAALNRTHHGALGFVALALLASIPWLGWQLMVPALFAVPLYHLAERRIRGARRPEYLLAGAWLLVQLSIFAGSLLVAEPQPYMLVLFAPMLIGMTAVFPTRGVLLLSVVTLGLTSAAGALARPDLVTTYPGVIAPHVLVVAWIALMSGVAGRASIEHRVRAVVDPLTGVLTRAALRSRLEEVAHESQVPGARVSVIAFDIDDFKALNDAHGHAVGDEVLRATGSALRAQLHALEWAFRLGGDEFLVVVPCGEREAFALAEQIRAALTRVRVREIAITGSFGVAESTPGARFDFEGMSRRADTALYEAKRAGRNCVAISPRPVITTGVPLSHVGQSPLKRYSI